MNLPRGIVPVVQTPFDADGQVDLSGLARLADDAIASGAVGLLAPVVASEVAWLSDEERDAIVRTLAEVSRGRVPFLVGASSDQPQTCRRHAALAEEVGAAAWLAAVPAALYGRPEEVLPFFRTAVGDCGLPLILQDFQLGGPGLAIPVIEGLREALPSLAGIKIETAPAGPKYTAVRKACGPDFFIAGGWAVPQMIEALDRGVAAMIPESSMVRVYAAVYRLYQQKQRAEAACLFRSLLPVLSFSNQDVPLSVAFFKRLLVRKGIFTGGGMRWPGFAWDEYNRRVADELIDLYLNLERRTQTP